MAFILDNVIAKTITNVSLNGTHHLYIWKMFLFKRKLHMDLGMSIFLYNLSLKLLLMVIILLITKETNYRIIYLMI